jgi:hypothetical protein
MKKAFEQFSRIIALVLLVTVTFVSCFDNPPEEPLKLTPGVGTPRSFYLDSDGNVLETEPDDGSGRTGLIVEDNKLAEGVLIYSDDTTAEDRVAFVYEDSIVSMFFKKGSNFPHRMAISNGSEDCTAYILPYNAETNTCRIAFLNKRSYWRVDPVVLNRNIFTLYEEDTALTDSQNRRMANMTIAMGVWGSLYALVEKRADFFYYMLLRFGFNAVVTAFSYVAVASAVTAYVAVPVGSFIKPAAEMVIANVVPAVAAISTEITYASSKLVEWLENKETKQLDIENEPVNVFVYRVYENGDESLVNYYDNGEPDEFHTRKGDEIKLKFVFPSGFDINSLLDTSVSVWFNEPALLEEDKSELMALNLYSFTPNFPIIEKTADNNIFYAKFTRGLSRYGGDGRINFGFIFNVCYSDGKPVELQVNGYAGGFNFWLPDENVAANEPHKNMAVVRFCVLEDCPDLLTPDTGGDEDGDEGAPP